MNYGLLNKELKEFVNKFGKRAWFNAFVEVKDAYLKALHDVDCMQEDFNERFKFYLGFITNPHGYSLNVELASEFKMSEIREDQLKQDILFRDIIITLN